MVNIVEFETHCFSTKFKCTQIQTHRLSFLVRYTENLCISKRTVCFEMHGTKKLASGWRARADCLGQKGAARPNGKLQRNHNRYLER